MKRFLKLTLAVWLCVWMVVATAWATDTGIGNAEPGAVGPYAEESGFSLSAPFESGQTYEINDADDLKAVRDYVNIGNDCDGVTFQLAADISLSGEWEPIGGPTEKFSGTFDGNGHKITGLNINSESGYQGLFGYVNSTGVVKDLTVSGNVTGNGAYVGGVVAYNLGTVENCENNGNITSNSGDIGGVVGENIGNVSDCYNTGKVSGNSRVGGVVGYNSGRVANCENSGSVTGSNTIGGVAGENTSGTVQNCKNSGTVTGSSNKVGGVVGSTSARDGQGEITNCYNTGDVQSSRYVGGVTGSSDGKETNCYNTGKVSGNSYVGGLIGYKSSRNLVNCYYLDETCADAFGELYSEAEAASDGVQAKTSAELHSGEVAVLLGTEWGQRLTGDTYPELFALTDDPEAYRLYQVRYHYQDESGSQQTEEAYINLDSTLKKLTSQEGLALVWYLDEECTAPFTSAALSSDEVLDLYGKWEEVPEEDDPGADLPGTDPSTPGAGGGEGSDTPGAGGSQSGGPAAPSGEETAKDSRDRDPGRDANYEAILAAIKEVKAANAGKTGKVREYLTAAEAAVPAVPVKLYGLNASLPVDGMKTLAEGPTGLKVILDNGAAEVLIPGGFALAGDPGRVYYPLGFWKDPYGADLLKERVKGQNAGTEVCQLGGGTLPTTVTVTIKTKLTGAVNIYHWDEETRKATLLASATAAGGKVTFAARQLGTLVVTTGTL